MWLQLYSIVWIKDLEKNGSLKFANLNIWEIFNVERTIIYCRITKAHVCFLVSLQVFGSGETRAALITRIWHSLVVFILLMSFEMANRCGHIFAFVTWISYAIVLWFSVSLKVTGCCWGKVALITCKPPYALVLCFFVWLEMVGSSSHVIALITWIQNTLVHNSLVAAHWAWVGCNKVALVALKLGFLERWMNRLRPEPLGLNWKWIYYCNMP